MAVPIPEKRVADFENMAFGLFIHYGLYSQLGRGEWIMNAKNMSVADYSPLAKTFTAKGFNAEEIAKTARDAGMKYITLTTRHHDGFSLYDTKGLCNYDAPHSAAGRDLVREFVDACNEYGIMPMFYHTTLDWYQESFKTDFKSYLQYLQDSVEVLCTEYGKIGGLWFDGNWSRPATDWDEDGLYKMIRKHQPDALIINNTGLSARGAAGNPEIDSVTFEQGRPNPMNREGMPKYLAAEMCHTMNGHWGYSGGDLNYKSLAEMIETLCACRKVGANYLLNIGPDGDGNIVPMQKVIIDNMGVWMKNCGSCMYHGRPSKIQGEYKNFALEGDNRAYLFVHNLSVNGCSDVVVEGGGYGDKLFKNVTRKVKSVKWTDNDEKLTFVQQGDSLTVNATAFPYGSNYIVRVAEVEFDD